MPFTCAICGEESMRICARCTKDTCANHLCERCLRCSDCCDCELTLGEPTREPVRAVVRPQAPAPEPPPSAEATPAFEPPTESEPEPTMEVEAPPEPETASELSTPEHEATTEPEQKSEPEPWPGGNLS
jgi:hypothetical protein